MNDEDAESTSPASAAAKRRRLSRSGLPSVPISASEVKSISDSARLTLELVAQAVQPPEKFAPLLQFRDLIDEKYSRIYETQLYHLQELIDSIPPLEIALWPDNLRAIKKFDLEDVYQVSLEEGITLYAVPRAEIVEALLAAKDGTARRRIVGRKQAEIIVDCKAVLANCRKTDHKEYLDAAAAAIKAFEAGHVQAAQALFGSLCDALLVKYLGETLKRTLTRKKWEGKTENAYDQLPAFDYVALTAMRAIYTQYKPDQGQPIPLTFNRHATAHTVSPIQFTRLNTIQAMMTVTGILAFVEVNGFPANRS